MKGLDDFKADLRDPRKRFAIAAGGLVVVVLGLRAKRKAASTGGGTGAGGATAPGGGTLVRSGSSSPSGFGSGYGGGTPNATSPGGTPVTNLDLVSNALTGLTSATVDLRGLISDVTVSNAQTAAAAATNAGATQITAATATASPPAPPSDPWAALRPYIGSFVRTPRGDYFGVYAPGTLNGNTDVVVLNEDFQHVAAHGGADAHTLVTDPGAVAKLGQYVGQT